MKGRVPQTTRGISITRKITIHKTPPLPLLNSNITTTLNNTFQQIWVPITDKKSYLAAQYTARVA